MRYFKGLKTLGAVLALVLFCGHSTVARAAEQSGWNFKPAVMYLLQSYESGGSKTDITRTLFDLMLGYKLTSPLYLGGHYSYEQISESSPGSTRKTTFSAYGPTVGLVTENLYLLFSYFVSATGEVDPSTKYSSGSGFQATLGYKFNLASSVDIAPELGYRSLSFTKVSTGGAEVSTDYKYTTLVPYVAFWFYF